MLVVYHGDGAGKESAAIGVLFRAHGRELPVRRFDFAGTTPDGPSGDDLGLRRLEIPADAIGTPGPEGAARLWRTATHELKAMREGVLVLEHLLDAIAEGWLAAPDVTEGLAGKSPLLHVIVTGDTAPPGLIEAADLVTNMKAIKKRDRGAPAIAGIDY